MSSMFRRRHSSADVGLPTTSAPTAKRPSLLVPLRSSAGDGSAGSIRLSKPLSVVWKQASTATKATYICFFVFIFMVYFGVRHLRYYNAHIHLDCQSLDCTLSLRPTGWNRKVVIDFPRRQLTSVYAVKTTESGTVVRERPSLNDDLTNRNNRNKQYSSHSMSQYKGPDMNGHYTSYAIVLKQPGTIGDHRHNEDGDQSVEQGEQDADGGPRLVDLTPLHVFGEIIEGGDFRLTFRNFRIGQSNRRVRTMLNRVDSYIKKRRQRLVVKENGTPSWQGILLIVMGTVGFLLTLLIGQFIEDAPLATGPAARRRSSQMSSERRRFSADTFQRTTPARYEVRTKPAVQTNSKSSGRNSTTARRKSASSGSRRSVY